MVSARLYIEGGGDGKAGKSRCREGFRKLLKKCDFAGQMPSLTACGSRESAYDRFKSAQEHGPKECYVALLIDSEEPLSNIDETWDHLVRRDRWQKPRGARDDQVLFMTTCMETWIVADYNALRVHFGQGIQLSALPPADDLERRPRDEVLAKLMHATRNCLAPYEKGAKSFVVLGKLNPATLDSCLPSFQRARRILNTKL